MFHNSILKVLVLVSFLLLDPLKIREVSAEVLSERTELYLKLDHALRVNAGQKISLHGDLLCRDLRWRYTGQAGSKIGSMEFPFGDSSFALWVNLDRDDVQEIDSEPGTWSVELESRSSSSDNLGFSTHHRGTRHVMTFENQTHRLVGYRASTQDFDLYLTDLIPAVLGKPDLLHSWKTLLTCDEGLAEFPVPVTAPRAVPGNWEDDDQLTVYFGQVSLDQLLPGSEYATVGVTGTKGYEVLKEKFVSSDSVLFEGKNWREQLGDAVSFLFEGYEDGMLWFVGPGDPVIRRELSLAEIHDLMNLAGDQPRCSKQTRYECRTIPGTSAVDCRFRRRARVFGAPGFFLRVQFLLEKIRSGA